MDIEISPKNDGGGTLSSPTANTAIAYRSSRDSILGMIKHSGKCNSTAKMCLQNCPDLPTAHEHVLILGSTR